jgi:hypothetical protein
MPVETVTTKTVWGRWARLIGGWLLIAVGLAGFVLPVIPGIPLLLGGLAPEYVWASQAMEWVKDRVERIRKKNTKSAVSTELPNQPPTERKDS